MCWPNYAFKARSYFITQVSFAYRVSNKFFLISKKKNIGINEKIKM